MTNNDIQKFKGRWLIRIAEIVWDSGLAVRSAIILMDYIDREYACETGVLVAYPAQQTLADRMGASRDGVKRALEKLAERGLLEIVPGKGKGNSSRYYFKLPDN
jgi:MarR-like DNA-binding transcriptional regulator SgrR of sgrS sRNA